jgi:DNA-binding CsgD family transcriptional regulator
MFASLLWDDAARFEIIDRTGAVARRTGALQVLGLAHFVQGLAETALGRLTSADRYEAAGLRLRRAIGVVGGEENVWRHPELLAWHAADDGVETRLERSLVALEQLGHGAMTTLVNHALGVLALGGGDYARARERLEPLVGLGRPGLYARVLPDLVEAAARSGDRALAEAALADLATAATASGTPWALGLLARSRALLAGPEEAAELYRESLAVLPATRAHGDLARAHLLYGEWLRRRRRRRDAREHLGRALELFEEVDARAFAARTRQELLATGGDASVPPPGTGHDLTPQEAAVARLARQGATNPEIAAYLFISPNTVDYHLRKVYRKLGVSSRRRLEAALPDLD